MDDKSLDEPASLKEAMARHDWSEWKKAMEIEYNLLMKNGTWEIVSLPKGANMITRKWVSN